VLLRLLCPLFLAGTQRTRPSAHFPFSPAFILMCNVTNGRLTSSNSSHHQCSHLFTPRIVKVGGPHLLAPDIMGVRRTWPFLFPGRPPRGSVSLSPGRCRRRTLLFIFLRASMSFSFYLLVSRVSFPRFGKMHFPSVHFIHSIRD